MCEDFPTTQAKSKSFWWLLQGFIFKAGVHWTVACLHSIPVYGLWGFWTSKMAPWWKETIYNEIIYLKLSIRQELLAVKPWHRKGMFQFPRNIRAHQWILKYCFPTDLKCVTVSVLPLTLAMRAAVSFSCESTVWQALCLFFCHVMRVSKIDEI